MIQLPVFKKNAIKNLGFVIALATLVIFSTRVIIRNSDWKDPLTLYSRDLEVNQSSNILEHLLGVELYKIKNLDEAQTHLMNSIKLYPSMIGWTDLGVVYVKSGKINEAKVAFQKSFEYGDFEPAYQYLSILMLTTEKPEIAERFIKDALNKFPKNYKLWLYLALVQQKLGNQQNEALGSANKAYLISPNQETFDVLDSIRKKQD